MYQVFFLLLAVLLGNALPCALPEQNLLTFTIVSLLHGFNAIINLIFASITLVVSHSHAQNAKYAPVRVRACGHKSHIKDMENEKAKYNALWRQFVDDSNQYVREIAELEKTNKDLTTYNDYLGTENRNKKFTIKELRRNLTAANKTLSKPPPLRVITTAEKHKASGYDKVIELRAEVEKLQRARRDDEYKINRLTAALQLANDKLQDAENRAQKAAGLQTKLAVKEHRIKKDWEERCALKTKVEELESAKSFLPLPSAAPVKQDAGTQTEADADADAETEYEDDEEDDDDDDDEDDEDAEEDGEDWDDDEEAEEEVAAPASTGRSLFDRLTMGADGKPVRDIEALKKMEGEAEPKNIFGYLAKK